MAWETLADFFAAYHNCTNWDLQRAIVNCANGPYRESLRKAAYAWRPETTFHKTLKRMMVTDNLPPLAGRGIARIQRNTHANATSTVTRVRKKLEVWLNEHGHPLPEPPPPLPPLQIRNVWDIFNATDRYSKNDIKGGIWHAMYGNYGDNDAWKLPIQWHARWRTANSPWEQELIILILTEPKPARPETRTTTMYNLSRRIKAWLSKNSTYCPDPLPTREKPDGRPRSQSQQSPEQLRTRTYRRAGTSTHTLTPSRG